jgi:methenyltetrahydromethanopterin cyclohydrolase
VSEERDLPEDVLPEPPAPAAPAIGGDGPEANPVRDLAAFEDRLPADEEPERPAAPAAGAALPGLDRIHEGAWEAADAMAERAAEIGVLVTTLPNGTRLIDAGVQAPGSLEAGRLFAAACLGGLGVVRIAARRLGPHTVPEARVAVSAPLAGCMGAQYAGWRIRYEDFFAMGSGPARAQAAAEPIFERYPLAVRGPRTVLLLETTLLPDAAVADALAARCDLPPEALTLVAAATGTPAGATQIAARSVETALHKLFELSFDLTTVVAGAGSCPIAPPVADPLRAIGRTNDAVLYGAEVTLWVRAGVAAVRDVLDSLPSCASEDYGRPFYELFREHGDFYKIDPLLFSPARVTFITAPDRQSFSAGSTNEALLLRSFGFGGEP